MIETKRYFAIGKVACEQGAIEKILVYCQTIEAAKAATSWWIEKHSGKPYILKWEKMPYGEQALIPYEEDHPLRNYYFTIKEKELPLLVGDYSNEEQEIEF